MLCEDDRPSMSNLLGIILNIYILVSGRQSGRHSSASCISYMWRCFFHVFFDKSFTIYLLSS
jgi:hypothetical protein